MLVLPQPVATPRGLQPTRIVDFPVALEAEVVDPAGQRRTVSFDTDGTACDLETEVELEGKWWKTHKVVRYGPVLYQQITVLWISKM